MGLRALLRTQPCWHSSSHHLPSNIIGAGILGRQTRFLHGPVVKISTFSGSGCSISAALLFKTATFSKALLFALFPVVVRLYRRMGLLGLLADGEQLSPF